MVGERHPSSRELRTPPARLYDMKRWVDNAKSWLFIALAVTVSSSCSLTGGALSEDAQELAELRADLVSWPTEHKMVLDQDVVVFFTYSHPARLWDQTASIYHLPSLSSVDFNANGDIAARQYRSAEGEKRLEGAIQDPVLLSRIKERIPWDSR